MFRAGFRIFLLATFAVAVAAPGLGPATGAGAAPRDRVVEKSHTKPVPPGQVGQVVDCPDGTRLIGTGVSLAALARSFRYLGTRFTERSAVFRIENLGSEAFPFTGTVLCLRASSGVSHPATDHDVPIGVVTTAESSCPVGTRRLGGAGNALSTRKGPPPYLLGSSPGVGLGWAVRVENSFPNAMPAKLTIQTACADAAALGNLRVQEVVRRDLVVAGNGRARETASCPRGAEVAAGGFIVNTQGMLLSTSQPAVVPRGQPEGWTVSVINRSPEPLVFTAAAICMVPS